MYSTKEDINQFFAGFKKAEKFYKKKKKLEQLPDLITLNESEEILNKKGIKSEKVNYQDKSYTIYHFDFPPGFKIIKRYLTQEQQVKIAFACLNDFPKKPHRNNLYIYEPDYLKKKDALYADNKGYEKSKFIINDPERFFFNTKIRWVNLGMHYDWDNRCYFKDSISDIPEEMIKIAKYTIDFLKMENYHPQSVIVNYYGHKDTMGGHLDDGEPDQENPILSFSIGLSCIFLIGGKTKEIEPLAIKLDSGDLAIMSKESRVCFHGVPRIFENSFALDQSSLNNFENYEKNDDHKNNPQDILGKEKEKNENNLSLDKEDYYLYENKLKHVLKYLSEFRINFNFRQVENN